MRLDVGRGRSVTILDGPAHLGGDVPHLLVVLGRCLGDRILLSCDVAVTLKSREDRNIQGQLDIFTTIVLELCAERVGYRAAARVGEVGRGPSGVGVQ